MEKGQILENGKKIVKDALGYVVIGLGVFGLGLAAGAGFRAGTRTADRIASGSGNTTTVTPMVKK